MIVTIDLNLGQAQQVLIYQKHGKIHLNLTGYSLENILMISTSTTGIAFSSFTVTVQAIKVIYKNLFKSILQIFISEGITIPLLTSTLCSHFSLLS